MLRNYLLGWVIIVLLVIYGAYIHFKKERLLKADPNAKINVFYLWRVNRLLSLQDEPTRRRIDSAIFWGLVSLLILRSLLMIRSCTH